MGIKESKKRLEEIIKELEKTRDGIKWARIAIQREFMRKYRK